MSPVEIHHHQGTVVLRARSSELLILPQHVQELRDLKEPAEFSRYFTQKALLNRPARKLFESWARRDRSVWPRLYKVIHEEVEIPEDEAETPTPTEAGNEA